MSDDKTKTVNTLLDSLIDSNLHEALKRDMELFALDPYHTGNPALYSSISQFLKNQGIEVDKEADEGLSSVAANAAKVMDKRKARAAHKLASVSTLPRYDDTGN
jgi:precorrin-4 methylase